MAWKIFEDAFEKKEREMQEYQARAQAEAQPFDLEAKKCAAIGSYLQYAPKNEGELQEKRNGSWRLWSRAVRDSDHDPLIEEPGAYWSDAGTTVRVREGLTSDSGVTLRIKE